MGGGDVWWMRVEGSASKRRAAGPHNSRTLYCPLPPQLVQRFRHRLTPHRQRWERRRSNTEGSLERPRSADRAWHRRLTMAVLLAATGSNSIRKAVQTIVLICAQTLSSRRSDLEKENPFVCNSSNTAKAQGNRTGRRSRHEHKISFKAPYFFDF